MDWREYETDTTDTVFRNDGKKPFPEDDSGSVGQGLKRLLSTHPWSFKHLRNIAPTLRKKSKLHPEMSDAILGHSVRGTSRFYEGDIGDDYLLPLVKMVGKEYFGGEKIV